jgi:hypothetical protein
MRLGASIILAVGLLGSAAVLGAFLVEARGARDVIRVTGASTRPFSSDVVKWRVTFRASGPAGDARAAVEDLRASVTGFLSAIEARGIDPATVNRQPVSSYPRYDNQGQEVGVEVNQSLFLVTESIEVVEDLANDPVALLDAGVNLGGSNVEYFYSEIDTLKHVLLAGAADDARRRAEEIMKTTGRGVGDLLEARAGVFQITEPYSTEVSGYGMHATGTREKEITVTVHATFGLR